MAWWVELQFAAKRLRRAPAFAISIVLMLTVALGLSVAMFGVLNGVLSSLPYPGGDRLVAVYGANDRQGVNNGALTGAEVDQLAIANPQSPLQSFGDYAWGGLTVIDDQQPREFGVAIVGPGFFATLGMQPLMGRLFTEEEHQSAPGTIVLSHSEWQRQFAGSADAIGQTIDTDRGRAQVIGVMPPSFSFPAADIGGWVPRTPANVAVPGYRFARSYYGIALLVDGIHPAQLTDWFSAQANAVRTAQRLDDEGWNFSTLGVLDEMVGDVRGTLWGAFAITLLVLLIACANVAILFDARQIERRREDVISHALGASSAQLWRSRVFELLALTALGAIAGAFCARAVVDLVSRLAQNHLPRADAISFDSGALAFGIALTMLTPALVLAAGKLRQRSSAANLLRSGAVGVVEGNSGPRKLLPGLAIALSTISLITAAALGLSVFRLGNVSPGFEAQGISAMQLFRSSPPDQWGPFAEQMRERLLTLPGVDKVAMTTAAPWSNIGSAAEDTRPTETPNAQPVRAVVRRVGPDYLSLLSIPLLRGRAISEDDRAGGERVAVINRSLATRTFGDAPALDRQISLALGREGTVSYRVVGVMEDTHNNGLRVPPGPEILVSYAQQPWVGMTFMVKTQTGIQAVAAQMSEKLWAIDPRQSITRQFNLADDLDAQLQSARFFALMVSVFALCSLLLGVFGVYAVAAQSQRRRVREFGLRLAIGANPLKLGLHVFRDGLLVVGIGAVAGIAGSAAVLRLLSAQTFGLESLLLWIMIGGAAFMAAVAMAALMIPALRAMRTDPMSALRAD